MQEFAIKTKVSTPHGTGTILRFEHIEHVNLPIEMRDFYTEGDRIEVVLDHPELWVQGVGNPHYAAKDIQTIQEV